MKYITFFWLMLWTVSLKAAVFTVENTNDSGTGSLREAFANVNHGDTIVFSASLANQTIVLTSGKLLTTKSITIDGKDAPNLTIDGNNNDRIFHLSWEFDAAQGENVPTTVTIKNLKLINGRAKGLDEDGAGGAIYMLPVGQTLTVNNCIFENNYSEGEGGAAIYCGNKGILTVDSCQFIGNTAETNDDGADTDKGERGGTISTNGQGTLTVTNSEFKNNKGVNGAGINTVDTNLEVENCLFENNDVRPAIPSPAAMPSFRAYGYGAGIYTDGANRTASQKYITVRNCRFINNKSSGQGGGAFLYGYNGDVITVEYCTFAQNEVISAAFGGNNFSIGGGLVISGGGQGSRTGSLPPIQAYLRKSAFYKNKSYDQGGGVWLRITDGGTTEVSNCTIAYNQSSAENPTATKGLGGGLAIVTDAVTTLNHLTIARNEASFQGGGIYCRETNQITLKNSIVALNKALNGGNDWNIMHNTNQVMKAGSNNIQSNENGTADRFLSKLTTDVQITDPLLDSLANNGGLSLTLALQENSPAIDAGVDCNTTDQRNAPRVGTCDIGAFEFGGTPDTTVSITPTTSSSSEGNKIKAFNILSPNGDGQNDQWQVTNLASVDSYTIRVFTKAGQVVFTTNNYQGNWAGTYQDNPLPSGIYYYIITTNHRGVKNTVTGYITLIR